jgi:transposase
MSREGTIRVFSTIQGTSPFVLLPRRWVVERSIAWMARFRRLVRDYERLPQILGQLHWLAAACLMLNFLSQLSS